MSRRDRTAWVGSVAIHAVAIGLAWASTLVAPDPLQFETFEIELVSAPAPEEPETEPAAEEELVVETPDPEPPAEEEPVEEESPVETPEERQPEPEPEEPEPEPEEPEPEPEEEQPTPTPETPPEEPTESATAEEINVRAERLERDYPAYYEEIVRQIDRCFRRPDTRGQLRATVQFLIRRDGRIPGSSIELVRRSGDIDLDLRSVAAVECAGQRLSPLPEDLPWEELPVRFNFDSSGNDGRS